MFIYEREREREFVGPCVSDASVAEKFKQYAVKRRIKLILFDMIILFFIVYVCMICWEFDLVDKSRAAGRRIKQSKTTAETH